MVVSWKNGNKRRGESNNSPLGLESSCGLHCRPSSLSAPLESIFVSISCAWNEILQIATCEICIVVKLGTIHLLRESESSGQKRTKRHPETETQAGLTSTSQQTRNTVRDLFQHSLLLAQQIPMMLIIVICWVSGTASRRVPLSVQSIGTREDMSRNAETRISRVNKQHSILTRHGTGPCHHYQSEAESATWWLSRVIKEYPLDDADDDANEPR